MLLTSSQVSVLLTCGMVLLCTSALFISGCLIQQRTLRDLRYAIKPAVVTRPKPKTWDIDALTRTKTTIRLEDGTLVEIQSRPEPEVVGDVPEVIEVRPTEPETVEPGQKRDDGENGEYGSGDDDFPLDVKPAWDGVQEGGEPLTRAERRRRIKAEIQRLSRGDTPVYYQRRLW
ncbi:hypothetical protein F5B22DRAFT_363790 [Xylaria bambusicola]|uniref:uncharacterized protein n=1 Tax=Xylaria bambusicola TaxID=326684 RepID=UPI00200877C3|nr:uncharacterized protein F5B22DRAFT_363790 [Xylaria bambusicola]KAI0509171.1 hypothetical protein F5B22DRAFT_363790 [Xylaria bambusicola]